MQPYRMCSSWHVQFFARRVDFDAAYAKEDGIVGAVRCLSDDTALFLAKKTYPRRHQGPFEVCGKGGSIEACKLGPGVRLWKLWQRAQGLGAGLRGCLVPTLATRGGHGLVNLNQFYAGWTQNSIQESSLPGRSHPSTFCRETFFSKQRWLWALSQLMWNLLGGLQAAELPEVGDALLRGGIGCRRSFGVGNSLLLFGMPMGASLAQSRTGRCKCVCGTLKLANSEACLIFCIFLLSAWKNGDSRVCDSFRSWDLGLPRA